MKDNTKSIGISYLDFIFQDEYFGQYKVIKPLIKDLKYYLEIERKAEWKENFIYINVRLGEYDINIERVFHSDTESTMRYIQRDAQKKVVIDRDGLNKDEVLELIQNFFAMIEKERS